MSILSEAEALRDKILQVAPKAIKDAEENKWAVAVLCAEAYFKEQAMNVDNNYDGDEEPTQSVLNLFLHESSLWYICKLTDKHEENVISILVDKNIPAVASDLFYNVCDIDAILKGRRYPFPRYARLEKDIDTWASELDVSDRTFFQGYRSSGTKDEILLWKEMFKNGFNAADIAVHAGVDLSFVFKTLNIPVLIDSKVQSILNLWSAGRSISVITAALDSNSNYVKNVLTMIGYSIPEGSESFITLNDINRDQNANHLMIPMYSLDDKQRVILFTLLNLSHDTACIASHFGVPETLVRKWLVEYTIKV